MTTKQRTFGQFETPPDVADLLLGFCLRRASDRLLDPSCGKGALLRRAVRWKEWLADTPADIVPDGLWGVELDPETAESARAIIPQAQILTQNFFTLDPETIKPFDAIIGNPPYTRAEWFGRLHHAAGQQLALELTESAPGPEPVSKQQLLPRYLWQKLDARSGLHAYFFLHCSSFLREGGRLGFVVPNGWLDVAYGRRLKQFLLDHFRIIAVIESSVKRWFVHAKVNTCLVILEKCDGPDRRERNRVRLIRLKRPLTDLTPGELNDRQRPALMDRLVTRLLPGSSRQAADFSVRVVPQGKLEAEAKWGLSLRAPTVYQKHISQSNAVPLGSWAAIRRGYTTGANAFFYLTPEVVDKWGIESRFRRPMLKSLRAVDEICLTSASCHHELLMVPDSADIRNTAVAAYISWGERKGYHRRRTCAERRPWYSLQEQQHAQLILPKGIWQRHFAVTLDEDIYIDQQLYGLNVKADVSLMAAAAMLNSAWFALQCELRGRINFGEGVLWLAAYEIGSMRLPDPRRLQSSQVAELENCVSRLARRRLQNVETELSQPDRQALDAAVFDLLGFSQQERGAARDALLECVKTRLRRADAVE